MILSFELTMPNVGSWNGKWSRSGKAYFIFKTVKKAEFDNIMQGRDTRNFYYDFKDGWGANVRVELISSAEKNKRKKISAGFCSYDWMVDSIIKHGEIKIDK